jgi:polyphosphate glucokinase
MLVAMTDMSDAPSVDVPPPFTGLVSTGTGVIGVDVGGSGIKAAPVDLAAGTLTAERIRLDTPHPSTPDAVASTVAEVVGRVVQECGPGAIAPQAAVGLTLPSVIRGGVVRTAANIDPAWIGVHAVDLFSSALGRPVVVVNDADAAGVAEVRFGAGRDVPGVVLMLTLGTGIGSALFVDGVLVPNTELGHLPLRGGDAERYAASSVRKEEGLTMKKYAKRLEEYLELVERLLWPDLILIGGGISKRADEFLPHVHVQTPVRAAQLRNEAGIIGAALLTPTG